MLSKEEIEYIEELEKAIEDDESFYWQEDMYKLIEIIRKQHGREQKLIEKLEKKIRYFEENDEFIATSNDNYSDGTVIKRFIDEFKGILQIVKG